MKTVLLSLIGVIFGSFAFAGGPQQPRHDYDNAGFYQPELDAAVQWMADAHNASTDDVKAGYSFYWDFKINFEPQSLVIYFFGANDTCRVIADDIHNIQGQCSAN